MERDSATEVRPSHKSLATIVDGDGVEHDVLRDNMPFGRPGSGEYGTYFIGYSGELWVLERMLERMFVGDPPGTYDRLLDFSRAITGATFFAPARDRLVDLAALAAPPSPSVVTAPDATGPGLGIGSLRSTEGHTP